MITLFEYFVNRSPETDFMDKVREENPDLVNRYRSLILNKGLEVAKAKYLEVDPVEVKKREKVKKKEDKVLAKMVLDKLIRKQYGDQIETIKKMLDENSLDKLVLSRFETNLDLMDFTCKKVYKDLFEDMISKHIEKLPNKLELGLTIELESLELSDNISKIKIESNLKRGHWEVTFNIDFRMYLDSTQSSKYPSGYLKWRNEKIIGLSEFLDDCSKEELIQKLDNFEDIMSNSSKYIDLYKKELTQKRFDL